MSGIYSDKHHKDITKEFSKTAIDVSFFIIFLFGLSLLVGSFYIEDDFLKNMLNTVGAVITVSGIFSGILSWLAVRGVVRRELIDILFGDEYIENDGNFDLVWNRLLAAITKKNMPSLGQHSEYFKVLREYLPSSNELFYKEYSQQFDVAWEDKEKKLLRVDETTNITVVASNDNVHVLKYKFKGPVVGGKNKDYEITALKINKECKLDKVKEIKNDPENPNEIVIEYEIELEGSVQYSYFRRMVRIISFNHEPFIVLTSGRHTYKPRVTIKCSNDIKAFFTSTGTLKKFETLDGRNNSHCMIEEYPDLMVKGQGFSIYFTVA